jgi:arginine-tRNA-protein transferase
LPPPIDVRLVTTDEHPCAYLPGQVARNRALLAGRLGGSVYQAFMDAGFRRSGRMVYQPTCPACRACVAIRVPVSAFEPSKSQRRCARRNEDLSITSGDPRPTDEKYDLFRRYVLARHGDAMAERETFDSFLYESPVDTIEFTYRTRAGTLLAVGICDVSPASLSTVYFYFDPSEAKRGLGTFGAVREIAFARDTGIPHYYLGFWVRGCGAMEYKQQFQPSEFLHPDGAWRAHPPRVM